VQAFEALNAELTAGMFFRGLNLEYPSGKLSVLPDLTPACGTPGGLDYHNDFGMIETIRNHFGMKSTLHSRKNSYPERSSSPNVGQPTLSCFGPG
jgi:hypothetical protein